MEIKRDEENISPTKKREHKNKEKENPRINLA